MRKLLSAFMLCLFINSAHAKIILISDLDDTVRKSNVNSLTGMIRNYFKGVKPFESMARIYNDLKDDADKRGEEIVIYYVSSSIRFLYDADKWLKKYDFPKGTAIQRKFRGIKLPQSKKYKIETITKIINEENTDDSTILLFGDNSEYDAEVYTEIVDDLNLDNAHIFIRDVTTVSHDLAPELEVSGFDGVNYFLTEKQIINHEYFTMVSEYNRNHILLAFDSQLLIAPYVRKELRKRLVDVNCFLPLESCKTSQKKRSNQLWDIYHANNFQEFALLY